MKNIFLFIVLFKLFTLNTIADDVKTCNFFLIKENGSEVILEKVQLNENEVKVFKDPSIISYIMVFSPGSKSSELIQTGQRLDAIITQYVNDKIKINILRNDGSQREMPDLNIEEAKKIDIRLNITGANGYKKVYLIEKYETIKDGSGPVLNFFADINTLKKGEYSFCTESMESRVQETLEGSVPYGIYKGWITVNCLLPNGETGKFVVDFGAAQTTISKQSLPENFPVHKYEMVEYSAQGKKVSNATTAGASGMVENIAGVSIIPEFILGNIKLNDFKVLVISEFPKEFVEYGISGIIGRDVLLKTNSVQVCNFNNSKGKQELVFSKNINAGKKTDYVIPYKIAGGYLTIDGKIENIPVSYIFDSGAANTYISRDFIEDSNTPYKVLSEKKEISAGLDGKGSEYTAIQLKNIQIGNITLKEMNFLMGNTFALENIGLNKTVLLGMDFFSSYKNIVFDFDNQEIKLSY